MFNIVRVSTVRASTGGFINWMCGGGANSTINAATITPMETKGTDHINGGNYDTDLTDVMENQYDYSRLTDTTPELSASQLTTQNSVQNPNGTGWNVYVPAGYTLKLPTGTTVSSVNTTTDTVTLSNAPVTTGSGTSIPPALNFPGHPPVLGVHDPNT